MRSTSPAFAVLASIVLIMLASFLLTLLIPIESFFGAQGGEMVQLAAGHVPTMEDVYEEEDEMREVQREIRDMTE